MSQDLSVGQVVQALMFFPLPVEEGLHPRVNDTLFIQELKCVSPRDRGKITHVHPFFIRVEWDKYPDLGHLIVRSNINQSFRVVGNLHYTQVFSHNYLVGEIESIKHNSFSITRDSFSPGIWAGAEGSKILLIGKQERFVRVTKVDLEYRLIYTDTLLEVKQRNLPAWF